MVKASEQPATSTQIQTNLPNQNSGNTGSIVVANKQTEAFGGNLQEFYLQQLRARSSPSTNVNEQIAGLQDEGPEQAPFLPYSTNSVYGADNNEQFWEHYAQTNFHARVLH